MANKKRIGILTSGGDCAGLNAVIRAVVRHAVGTYEWEVVGICQATHGLMTRPPQIMTLGIEQVDSWLMLGGTVLGTTNKGNPFAFPMSDGTTIDRSQEIIDGYHQLNLDALIGIGGDGSLAILRRLAQQGDINFVAIPKTIDNDVNITEFSIGFDTAVSVATEAIDRLHFTAASHSRVMILEVMGRDAGHIALNSGIAGGAQIILIPEIPYKLENIYNKVRRRQKIGKNFSVAVVSEAVCTQSGETVQKMEQFGECRLGGIGQYFANEIAQATGAETRVTVLGHLQRGGISSPLDRVLGSAFGVAAVDLIATGQFDRMVTWQNREVRSVPITEAIKDYRAVDPQDTLVKTARGLGICLGDR
ncbi:ATP-dependent 6-phosphofructokinase [Lusitaniella coriacea LEGE 07157]|uniref:ATP-dependent 6-phosphofructokinase n=1 Tax=Lusitaniella coriacea LEGE 07157 TaxID=945747 RepID=A0A8J7E465_9CYAN|nr:ATP-dependent 6-phosphofructokinase [Lusitaniella coriacea]MBE9118304.1 ATP-dependent 6-phosphofructokinase [Lusitaniella coriacea LEGE 07157]